MGAVYLAMSGHREMETLCVVKRLLPKLLSQPEHVRRFRREADLARRLGHSNLAHTHNVGEVDGEVFLVQEFVEGHDVSDLLDELRHQGRVLPVPVAVHIASEIAQGLSYAHDFEQLALVHRDINPPNIRLTYSGEVKLLDFGIAASNLHDEAQGEHRGAGKLWHLAPEQVRPGGTVDRRTDLYALGVVLWELLTQRPVGTTREAGQEVQQPETEGEVLVWIARGQHQAPSVFNPEVPPKLDALVARATHVDPAKRFAAADELRRELAAFIPPGWTPEPVLSSLLKELFSPEAERAERHRLIEAGRHLLTQSGRHSRHGRRATDLSSSARDAEPPRRSVRLRWTVVGGVIAGVLLLILATSFLKCGTPIARRVADVRRAAVPAPLEVSRPAAPAGIEPPTVGSPVRPLPPAAAPVVAREPKPQPGAEGKSRPAPGSAKPGDEPSAPPKQPDAAPAPKADHLRLAREAFNRRDWPRALAEGKSAVAAGGGAEAHALLGNTCFKMGRFSDAEASYGKAVALDPRNSLLQERLRIARVRAQEARRGEEN
jgi:serine/threonine protein kinase